MKPLLFTFGLTYGGALASFVHPFTGFLVYVTFGILKPDALWLWAIPQGNYSRIVAVALLIGWLLHGTGDWRFGRGKAILGCLAGYWAIMILVSTTAPVPDLAWHEVETMTKTFLPILAGATLIDSVAKLKQLVWVIVLSQGYLAYEFNLMYFEFPLFVPQDWTHGGLDNNGIAITMVTSMGMAFFLGLHAGRGWQRLLALGCAGLMAHVVLFSNSRGGMLSMIVAGVITVILMPKKPGSMLLVCLAAAGILATTGETAQERFLSAFASKEEGSDQGGRRLENWAACLDYMTKEPFGIGPHHWPLVAPSYGLPAMEAHSTWLQTGAELGIPALACLLGFYLTTLALLYPLQKERAAVADPWLRYIARMVMCSLVSFLVAAQFVTVHGVELPYYIALLGIGILKLQSGAEGGAARDVATGGGGSTRVTTRAITGDRF